MNSGLFKMLPTNYSFTNHIYSMYINRFWYQITYKGWYVLKSNQPTNQPKVYILVPSSPHKEDVKQGQFLSRI